MLVLRIIEIMVFHSRRLWSYQWWTERSPVAVIQPGCDPGLALSLGDPGVFQPHAESVCQCIAWGSSCSSLGAATSKAKALQDFSIASGSNSTPPQMTFPFSYNQDHVLVPLCITMCSPGVSMLCWTHQNGSTLHHQSLVPRVLLYDYF